MPLFRGICWRPFSPVVVIIAGIIITFIIVEGRVLCCDCELGRGGRADGGWSLVLALFVMVCLCW